MRIIKKPDFIRTDAFQVKRLKIRWKKPRGKHNKIRLGKAGKPKRPKIGYSNTGELKYRINNLIPFLIKNENDLSLIKNDRHVAILSKNLGDKKRLSIVKKILNLKIKVANIKDLEDYYKKLEKIPQDRKEKKMIKKDRKEKSKEEIKKILKKKELEKEEKTEEQKQEEIELEKRKILEGK